MYEGMQVKLRSFWRAKLLYLQQIDLFQALPALPPDETYLSLRWLKGHVDTWANSMLLPPSVIEDSSPFLIHSI